MIGLCCAVVCNNQLEGLRKSAREDRNRMEREEKMRKFGFKTRSCVSKTMNLVSKTTDFFIKNDSKCR